MKNQQFTDLQDWLDAQTLCWQNLVSGDGDAVSDWQVLMNACQKLADQQLPAQSAELASAMTEQAKGFSRYGEALLKSLRDPEEGPGLEEAACQFSAHLQNQATASLMRHWQLPEQLSQFFSSLGIETPTLPGFPFLQEGVRNSQQHNQQRLKQLNSGLSAFRDALSSYLEQQKEINSKTTHLMVKTLKQNPQLSSLEELHAHWVEHYEHCYQQQLQTEAYQQIYGRLSNASMTLKKLFQQYWEQESRQFGLVPVSDYDQLLERHYDLRKELRRSGRKIRALEDKLQQLMTTGEQRYAALEKELQQLKLQQPATPKTGSPPK